jgi:hypothetical protein
MQRRVLTCLALASALDSLSIAPSAARSEIAQSRIVSELPDEPYPSVASNFWVVSGYDDGCTIKRISFGDASCSLNMELDHGGAWFTCGNGRSQSWRWTSWYIVDDVIKSIYETGHGDLPTHAEARKSWIGPVDYEGSEHAGYPMKIDVLEDWYPWEILKSETQPMQDQTGPFPIVTQAIVYETMHGQTRSFVGGRITFAPGAELTLYRWVEPDKTPEAALAGQILASISLTPVANPTADQAYEMARVCQRPKGK